MPRTCTICTHAQRAEIDRALVNDEPYRSITERFSVSAGAIARHKVEHLPATLVKAQDAEDVRNAIDVVKQLKAVNAACWQVLSDARASRDGELVLKATDRVLKQIELQAKLIGLLDQEGTTHITISAEWVQIRAVLMTTLAPYPDARAAVAQALLEVEP